jgi:hypothetical protein
MFFVLNKGTHEYARGAAALGPQFVTQVEGI